MASHDRNVRPVRAWRRPRASRLAVRLIAAALLAVVAVGLAIAARSDKWWWDNLAGPDSSNFVDIDQIDKSNVSQLEVAWFYPYATAGFNPIVVDDVMYTLGRNGSLIALDATTGKELWIHEGLNGITSRGVNYWQSEDGKNRRLLFSINSFLQAIDAKTGLSIPTFGMDGTVDLRRGLARAEGYAGRIQSNSPGKVWKNLLILGSAPGEAFVNPPGDIRAYDVITGKLMWQFHTVPLPGEFGYETWPKDAYKYVGGTNNWGSMSVDEQRGIVYIPLGSANYDFYGADRIGQNLFANCLLALDARTGKRLWHFQTIHHDLWDLDNVSAPMLVTVRHNGKRIDAVAHAGKTGFLYVFNRVTGEPLWPIEERAVPKSEMPGEYAWPTQPFPTKPPPFVRHTFTVDDVNPWLASPEQYEAMRERVSKARNEGIFTPPGLTDTISMPGNQGGSNWGTTAADPKKGMVFVVGVNQVAILKLEDVQTRTVERGRGGGGGGGGAALQAGFAAYQQHCNVCHGPDLRGRLPGVASLVGVTDRMGEDAIKAVVTGGQGEMRPVSSITEDEVSSVIAYLANSSPSAGRGRMAPRSAEPPGGFPPGPVVASGGAPQPPMPPRPTGPFYSGVGGNAGNTLYPPDVKDVPPTRYMTDYGVLASFTKPPYTTLTAYDLNTGEIKWQVPNGDHLPTIRAGGPSNTGGVGARYGVVVTKGGLVFHAGNDSKVRAYDEDTGQVLWTGTFNGGTSGVPVSYEAKGRQYFVIMSNQNCGRGGGGGRGGRGGEDEPPPVLDPTTPTGAIAFALPKK
ncbi:MAG: PQQ-binding-like beta-propeller repeat protein [Acidobacteria bacterium]|nr:PQQ-binding-like beta-propeller repeat protein [Acidobacteriota bacterium]